jgi:hypothetical protein
MLRFSGFKNAAGQAENYVVSSGSRGQVSMTFWDRKRVV